MGGSSYTPGERRPIAARDWALSQRVASWLARRGASPNAISVAGAVSAVGAGLAFAATPYLTAPWDRVAWLAAAALMQGRLLANMFDGMVALERGTASAVGELYNDVPDRVSDIAVFVGAGYGLGGDPDLGSLAACGALLTAYVRALGKACGAPQEFCGPMAKQQRMAVLTVIAVTYALAPRGWQPAWGEPARGLLTAGLLVIVLGTVVTTVRRLARVAAHLRQRRP